MRKPKKNEPRETLEVILHKFYRIYTWKKREDGDAPEETEIVTTDLDWLPDDDEWWDYDYDEESWADLHVLLPVLNKISEKHKDECDKIRFCIEMDEPYCYRYPRIEGTRLETDKEYDSRIKKMHAEYQKYLKKKEKNKVAKKKTKEKRIASLKKELQKLEASEN